MEAAERTHQRMYVTVEPPTFSVFLSSLSISQRSYTLQYFLVSLRFPLSLSLLSLRRCIFCCLFPFRFPFLLNSLLSALEANSAPLVHFVELKTSDMLKRMFSKEDLKTRHFSLCGQSRGSSRKPYHQYNEKEGRHRWNALEKSMFARSRDFVFKEIKTEQVGEILRESLPFETHGYKDQQVQQFSFRRFHEGD